MRHRPISRTTGATTSVIIGSPARRRRRSPPSCSRCPSRASGRLRLARLDGCARRYVWRSCGRAVRRDPSRGRRTPARGRGSSIAAQNASAWSGWATRRRLRRGHRPHGCRRGGGGAARDRRHARLAVRARARAARRAAGASGRRGCAARRPRPGPLEDRRPALRADRLVLRRRPGGVAQGSPTVAARSSAAGRTARASSSTRRRTR